MIDVHLFNDAACPWGYSARPALRVLGWRYGDQLRWHLVLIGLTEDRRQYELRGYDPLRSALGQLGFRRFGMPFCQRAEGAAERHRPGLPGGRRGAPP